jgi:hypothetical protein
MLKSMVHTKRLSKELGMKMGGGVIKVSEDNRKCSYGAFLPGGTQLRKVSGSAVWNVFVPTMDGWQVRLQHGI